MENCIYEGKEICTFDLKDINGYYINDLVIDWKIAASRGKLICSDCGQRVYLAAGPVKEPYFAHYDRQACSYGNLYESEELKKGKRVIYHLLKRSFPDHEIRARYRMGNGKYSTCYIPNPEGKDMAVDYRLQYSGIDSFNERNHYLSDNNIIPVYILGMNKNRKSNQISWYETLIQKSMGFCIYLDAENEKILLKKSFDFVLGKRRSVRNCEKLYSMGEILIKSDGSFLCDFQEECNKIEQSIRELKNAYDQNEVRLWRNRTSDIRPDILRNALDCLKRGENYLVSKKYMDFITEHKIDFMNGNNYFKM